jgi:purine-binding chemotaxis protein CheW
MKVTPRTLDEAQEDELRVLLERRAERLRELEQTEANREEVVHWVAEFPLGEERYALPLTRCAPRCP